MLEVRFHSEAYGGGDGSVRYETVSSAIVNSTGRNLPFDVAGHDSLEQTDVGGQHGSTFGERAEGQLVLRLRFVDRSEFAGPEFLDRNG
jgi:hypothetical protein